MEMFAQASKEKLLFASRLGTISTNDLWDLPLEHHSGKCLVTLAEAAQTAYEKTTSKSFLRAKNVKTDPILKLRLDILVYIIDYKQDLIEANEKKQSVKAEKQELLGALAAAKTGALAKLSPAEIQKKLDALG